MIESPNPLIVTLFRGTYTFGMVKSDIKPLGTHVLTTKRLLLRPITLGDSEAMFSWANDEEVTRYMRFETHHSLSHTRKIIKQWTSLYKDPYYFQWVIVEEEQQRVIGSIGLEVISFGDNHGEVGYCLNREYWNKGYITETLTEVLRFGFEDVGFNRIQASHSTNNPASGAVMLKVGMIREGGPMKEYYKSAQSGYQDSYLYALTSSQWRLLR